MGLDEDEDSSDTENCSPMDTRHMAVQTNISFLAETEEQCSLMAASVPDKFPTWENANTNNAGLL